MKHLTVTICLTIAVLLGSVGSQALEGSITLAPPDFSNLIPRDPDALRVNANDGHRWSQYNLGVMYLKGINGVPRDYLEAEKWLRKAAIQSYPAAQSALGGMYYTGIGVPKSYKKAVKWSRLSAEQGNVRAQFYLGSMYYNGHGVLKDYIYAYVWWNIAASLGDKEAFKNRDITEQQMTPAQISEAQKLARECVRKQYKRC